MDQEGGCGRGHVAGVGDFFGADGFGEGDDEAEEVLAGVGGVEADDVVGSCLCIGKVLAPHAPITRNDNL